ncbi:MAG: hypothetical protein PUP90_13330 [Nostoc sp. S4]|nr:hypothetical protein [Nostoc sp. S4]
MSKSVGVDARGVSKQSFTVACRGVVMMLWQLSRNVYLWLALSLAGGFSAVTMQSSWAEQLKSYSLHYALLGGDLGINLLALLVY